MNSKRKPSVALKLEELFGIDLRSLAVFRMGLALLILFDLLFRSLSLRTFYSDIGILPRHVLLEKFAGIGHLSVHLINGTSFYQAILFLIAGLFALALFFGYRTRIATLVSWFLLISLHSRNPVILQGGDILLRMLLFWGVFLPMGACYSIDSALNSSQEKPPPRIVSAASAALLLQICFVYWFTVALKTGPAWWKEGSAIYYALSIDQLVTPLGHYLLGFPQLMVLITYSTLLIEAFGPVLAFTPVFTGPLRTFAVFLMISLHAGMGVCLYLGPFPFIATVGWLVFLPSWFWEKIFRRLKTPDRLGLTIYYDGECGFCRKMVFLIRTFFLLPETPILIAQDDPVLFKEMQERNSWVVVDHQGGRHYQFEAMEFLCRLSPLLWPIAPLLRLRPITRCGDKIYERIATHRRTGSQILSFLKWRPLSTAPSPWLNATAVFFLVYIFLWNLRTTNFARYSKIFPPTLNGIGEIFRVDQMWNMFSPIPLTEDGWYVIPGKLKNGTEVDLFQEGKAVKWEKPEDIAGMYHGERWRKYMMNLWIGENSPYRLYFGQYLCRKWNSHHQGEEQLQTLQIDFMRETTLPNYQTPKIEKILVWDHNCLK